MLYFLNENVPNLFFWVLIEAPNMSKHTSRNRGATIKASRKIAHDKVFYILGQKGNFFQKIAAQSKIRYRPKSVYRYQCFSVHERWLVLKVWYMAGRPAQCFHHYIDSHCLCMPVKNEAHHHPLPLPDLYPLLQLYKHSEINHYVILLYMPGTHFSAGWMG